MNEIINKYLDGEISDTDRLAIESRIKLDKVFADEVAFYIAAKSSAKRLAQENQKAVWEKIHLKKKRSPKKNTRVLYFIGSFAAAASVIFILLFNFNNSSPEQYASKYIEANMNLLPQTMGDSEDSLSKAIEYFNDGRILEAKKTLVLLNKSDEVLEYLGIIALKENNFSEALVLFENLEKSEVSLINKGMFYRAITLLQLNRKKEAKEILITISKNKDAFGSKNAKEILNLW